MSANLALRSALMGAFWNPRKLFQNGEQGVWYDPSDLSTLFQDAAGTVPVTADGDPVGLMLDKSGNGNHASQSVAASRPTFREGGGIRWLEGDGVDDFIYNDTLPVGDNTLLCSVAFRAISGTNNLPSIAARADTLGLYNWVVRVNASGHPEMVYYQGTGTIAAPFITLTGQDNIGIDDVVTLKIASGVGYLRSARTGAQAAYNDPGAPLTTVSTFQFFRYFQDSEFLRYTNGRLYGAVLSDGVYSNDSAAKLDQYLATQAGVTL